MWHQVIDLYANYNNNYVKHDDAVKINEVDFAIELTITLMRQFLRLSSESQPPAVSPWMARP